MPIMVTLVYLLLNLKNDFFVTYESETLLIAPN
jgi:hypothetical protein